MRLLKLLVIVLLLILSVAIAGVALFLSGGICWFVPCDKPVHVSGHVVDGNGRPIENAVVEFYGVTRSTCHDGRFRFGGLLAARGFGIRVSKAGYKPYERQQRFAYYDITVTLRPETAPGASAATWREIHEEELATYSGCPEFTCGLDAHDRRAGQL